MSAAESGQVDGQDAVGAKATGGLNEDLVTFEPTHERSTEGAIDGNAAIAGIGFVGADELIGMELAGIDVEQQGHGAKDDPFAGKLPSDKDFAESQFLFQVMNLALEHETTLPGHEVLLIVDGYAEGPGFPKVVKDLGTNDPAQRGQLLQEAMMPGTGDGDLGHDGFLQSKGFGQAQRKKANNEYRTRNFES